MIKEFDLLAQTIKKLEKGAKTYYLPNTGNWGDALIRHGTLRFFNDNDIDFTEIFEISKINLNVKKSKTRNLIYGGGGGWCKFWSHSPLIINSLYKYFNQIIILPSSFELTHKKDNCIYFSRDKLESKKNMPHSMFCHDMAFYLQHSIKKYPKGKGAGRFFRTDKESAIVKLPSGNFDISVRSNHYGDVQTFFDIISKYRTIYTDRLHVAIAGAIISKEVKLHPGAYFKNRAVFASTLKKYFPNVTFINIISVAL